MERLPTIDVGGTADGTLEAVTETISGTATLTTGDGQKINDNFEDIGTTINAIIADIAAIRAKLGMTANETNARVIKVEEGFDAIGNIVYPIPRDYDEDADVLVFRVLASQVSVATDDDVQLDSELYKKRPGAALSVDLAPSAPSTVLNADEQWIAFDYSGKGFRRDDVAIIELLTDGHNDTDGEEVLIHAIELVYRSSLVSYDNKDDAEGNSLR